MRALPDPAFEFGDFVLVPKERLLLRGGEPVPLTAKAFDLLAILVQPQRASGQQGRAVRGSLAQHHSARDQSDREHLGFTQGVGAAGRNGKRIHPDGVGPRLPLCGAGPRTPQRCRARHARRARGTMTSDAAPKPAACCAMSGFGQSLRRVKRRGWALTRRRPRVRLDRARSLFGARRRKTSMSPFGSVAVLPFLSDSPGNNYLGRRSDRRHGQWARAIAEPCALHRRPNAFRYKGAAVRPKGRRS